MDTSTKTTGRVTPWNKGKVLGQKPPLKLKEIWAIRIRLQLDHRTRELALFNLAIDSKLRGCDLVALRVHDVVQGRAVAPRAIVMQKKTQRPVQFEITEQTRDELRASKRAYTRPCSPKRSRSSCSAPVHPRCNCPPPTSRSLPRWPSLMPSSCKQWALPA
jgi:hypothetical protein